MRAKKWVIRSVVPAIFILGFSLGWWPLVVLAPFIAMLYGHWLLALVLAWCADLIFGMPTGLFRFLVFPCTIAILAGIFARSVIIRHLR